MSWNGSSAGGTVWASLCDPEHGLSARQIGFPMKSLVFVAHPDDEAIGAAGILRRLSNPLIVYLTDGAPRDERFWSPDVRGSREEYARIRRREAVAALQLVGIPAHRILWLGAVDQDSVFETLALAEQFRIVLDWFVPEIVITHAYEGGHPDHDSAALIANMAVSMAGKGSEAELLELPLYHARNGDCVKGEFLPIEGRSELTIPLTADEQARKRATVACYYSQRRVLQGFPMETEKLRPAPEHDFTKPPHPGKLWYECLQWPMTGERWRELAGKALAQFHAGVCG